MLFYKTLWGNSAADSQVEHEWLTVSYVPQTIAVFCQIHSRDFTISR